MKTLNFFPWNLPKEYEKPKSQLLSVVDDTTLTFVATSDIPGLQIAESKLPDGTAGEAYKTKLTASGGNQPYVWSVPEGSQLPGQLTLSKFTGELKGVLTQSGRLTVDVKVEELIGNREGTQSIELFVHPDLIAPQIRSVTPSSSTPARDNTVVAIHFSEPLTKIAITEPEVDHLAFKWTFGGPGNLTEIPASEFNYSWNESGDTFYISHPEPLPIGSHTWTLNPDLPPANPGDNPALLFEDASGNPIEPNTSRNQSIRSMKITENEEGQSLIYRDIEEILLLKEQLREQDGRISNFRAATLDFTIGLPPGTFNSVRNASVAYPNNDIVDAPYFGLADSGSSRHFLNLVSRFEDLNRRYPNGIYTVNLETSHDGILTLPLNIQEDNYPKAALISNRCETQHIFHDQDFSLSLLNTSSPSGSEDRGDADIIQIVINETNGKKLHSLRESPGGVFEQFLQGKSEPDKIRQGPFGDEKSIKIPANSLEPNTDYFGYIRKIKIADENTSYEGVRVIGGYSTVTEFTLSTKNPRVACLSGVTPLRFWVGRETLNVPPQSATIGSLLPEVFTTATDETNPAEFDIGTNSKILLAPNSVSIFDSSGASQRAMILNLLKGSAEISSSAFDLGESKLLARTPVVTLELSTAILKVSHSQDLEITTVEIAEGSVLASRNDSTLPPVILVAGETIEFPTSEAPIPALRPILNIDHPHGNTLQVSWNHSTDEWQLFQSNSISNGVWNPVLPVPAQEENLFSANLETNEAQLFFRLQKSLVVID